MAMSLGTKAGLRAEINITPMIDVLLVLIIIFMVITPTTSVGLDALVPQPADSSHPQNEAIVVTVHGDGTYQLNSETLDLRGLRARLENLYRNGADQVIFVRGDKNLEFGQIAEVIDLARGAGVYRVGLMTD